MKLFGMTYMNKYMNIYLGWGPHGRKISDIFPPLGFSSTQGFSPVGTSPTWSLKGEKKLENVFRRTKEEEGTGEREKRKCGKEEGCKESRESVWD